MSHARSDGNTLLSTGVPGGDVLSNYVNFQNSTACEIYNQLHSLMRCPDFKALEVCNRICFVQKHKLCNNCLHDNHVY